MMKTKTTRAERHGRNEARFGRRGNVGSYH